MMTEGWPDIRNGDKVFWDAVVADVEARFPRIIEALHRAESSPVKDD